MPAQQVDLPSVDEFGIEAILRAIEPEIRSTLDSIAEICGRSKLSLANEYGSHIAPFGEVHPPSGELLAIQENTTNDMDGPADVDGHIVIVDDNNDLYGSSLGLLDDLRQTAIATGYPRATRVETQETNSNHQNRRGNISRAGTETRPPVTPVTGMEEFASTSSRPGSKALLGNVSAKAKTTNSAMTRTSPALLSETRLDAQSNRSSWPSEPPDTPRGSSMLPASSFTADRTSRNRISLVADVQNWLSWLKTIIQREKTSRQTFHSQSHSAEYSLRALLVRDQDQAIAIPTA
ncbi:hypothetical protein UA08_00374 [Talaromyces atroroseus]|uniref:Uncharacterized protein n=1 Tax=Talaromyces atroroseus TaxID=1441469 RepID=A0A225AWR2_TALAT|nr:hypothetical protein UA08_00374 [Talaromyces atroroseus]OKL64053.1 hypothetical protein UA08_00374 [Talaromyces atroroseus]